MDGGENRQMNHGREFGGGAAESVRVYGAFSRNSGAQPAFFALQHGGTVEDLNFPGFCVFFDEFGQEYASLGEIQNAAIFGRHFVLEQPSFDAGDVINPEGLFNLMLVSQPDGVAFDREADSFV